MVYRRHYSTVLYEYASTVRGRALPRLIMGFAENEVSKKYPGNIDLQCLRRKRQARRCPARRRRAPVRDRRGVPTLRRRYTRRGSRDLGVSRLPFVCRRLPCLACKLLDWDHSRTWMATAMAAMVAVASVVVRMAPAVVASTVVSIDGGAEPSWLINGEPVARGSAAEGLLLNARLIQAIFDDSNATTRDHWAYPDTGVWDPDRNTDEFIGNLTTWRAAGLRAFTVGLQGGSPHCYGNPEDWTVSAFRSDGTLIPAWLTRLQRVLYAADKLGMVPIVQYFYYAQFSKIEPAAVPAAATAISQWLAAMPLRNFLVEVFNEKCSDKPVTPLGLTIANLIDIVHNASDASRRAKGVAPLLVSASCGGGGIPSPEVVAASDFVLLHGNGQTPEKVEEMVANVRAMPAFIADPKPIVFNEDDHGHLVGEDEDAEKSAVPRSNLAAAVGANASWGFLCCCDGAVQGDYSTGFQCPPVNWAAVGACLSGPHGNEMPQVRA